MERFLQRIGEIWRPHPGQREFLTTSAKVKVLACGRRWGKTDACAVRVLYSLFQDWPTRHVLIAPTLDQAYLLFQRVRELLEALLDLEGREVRAKVRTTPFPRLEFGRHRVIARSGHLGRSLRGNEATEIIIDEAAFVPEDLVTEVAMPMLATTNGILTLISTPRGMNHFWRFFQMGQEGEHGVWSRRAPTSESPFIAPGFLDVQQELISERAYRTEYEAEFIESEGRIFRTEAIDAALVSQFDEPAAGPFFIGVDWARHTDYTAVAVVSGLRQNARLVNIVRFHAPSWKEQVGNVADFLGDYPGARIVCDATGVGDPLSDELKGLLRGARVDSLTFTAPIKASLIEQLAWHFEKGTLKMLSHPELIRELQHFEAHTTATGHRKLSARSGFHDDLVIALALACKELPKVSSSGPLVGRVRQFSNPPADRTSEVEFSSS